MTDMMKILRATPRMKRWLKESYADVYDVLIESNTAYDEKMAAATTGIAPEEEDASPSTNAYSKLMGQLYGCLHKLSVLGFNSGKHDLNTIKKFLILHLLLGDFLIWYNNRDVAPFLQAIDKLFAFY